MQLVFSVIRFGGRQSKALDRSKLISGSNMIFM